MHCVTFVNLIEYQAQSSFKEENYIEYLKTEMKQASDYNKDTYVINYFDYQLRENQSWKKSQRVFKIKFRYKESFDRPHRMVDF